MKKQIFAFIIIVLLALLIRVYGINWDQGQHLHPDERFLTMVATAQKLPTRISDYFNPQTSLLNPRNVGFSFYVYGTFPVSLAKTAAVLLHKDNYTEITLIGRLMSAFADIGTLIVVYLLAWLFENQYKLKKNWKTFAALFYAIAVLPIQQAHFFTVDSFLVFFTTATTYFCLRYLFYKKSIDVFIAGIFLGFALSTKISIVYFAPLFGTLLIWVHINWEKKRINVVSLLQPMFLFGLVGYLSLRILDPYFFVDAKVLHPFINPDLLGNLKQLNSFNNPESYYPPGIQWIGKTPFFALKNILFFGLGIPYFIFSVAGLYLLIRQRKTVFSILFFWIGIVFVYQSVQYVKSIRYFYWYYPYLALFAAYGFLQLRSFAKRSKNETTFALIALVLVWPLSFLTIYGRLHSRVQASLWIYNTIPQGAKLAEEYWDDPLPLGFPGLFANRYTYIPMAVFDPDSTEKWEKLNETLSTTDYIVFTSNRGYGSIMPLPEKYPQMSQFYKNLFAGKTQFVKVKEFTSYPTFLGIHIDDQWSDEAFTVYDHPKVTIFKRTQQTNLP